MNPVKRITDEGCRGQRKFMQYPAAGWRLVIKNIKLVVDRNIEDCKIDKRQWPSNYGWEGLRIKRYLADGQDEFSSHVDVRDYKDAKRFLTFFIYLDDNEGGRTSFPQIGKHANCKKGDILIFPPMWPWLHAGEKPIEKSKYILHSYLHYTWTKDE